MFWIISKVPLAMSTMSKAPCPMTVRFERSMTEGRTERPDGRELSVPFTKTSISEHDSHSVAGALIAFCTSVRLKYMDAPAGR